MNIIPRSLATLGTLTVAARAQAVTYSNNCGPLTQMSEQLSAGTSFALTFAAFMGLIGAISSIYGLLSRQLHWPVPKAAEGVTQSSYVIALILSGCLSAPGVVLSLGAGTAGVGASAETNIEDLLDGSDTSNFLGIKTTKCL